MYTRIRDIASNDADRLEAGRSTFFALKMDVLRRLLTALRSRDVKDLWSDCLRLLTDALTAEEAEFYLRMDRFYAGTDIRTGEVKDEQAELYAGGLTDLLEAVGHCEKELTLGTMDRTKRAILAIPEAGSSSCYFEAVGKPWRSQLDAALDLFAGLESKEGAFWAGFRRRVNEALENEFYEEVVIRMKVRRRLAATFEPQIRTFAEWQKAHWEATGSLPRLQLSSPPSPESRPANVFRKHGESWRVAFAGDEVIVADREGMSEIVTLLSNPGRGFPAMELMVTSRRPGPSRSEEALGRMSREELAKVGLSVSGVGHAGEIADPQAIAEYRQAYRDLEQELREAEADHDLEKLARIREAMAWYADQLSGATGLGGRPRRASDDTERARKAVAGRIGRCIERIKKVHPVLAGHLDRSIERGTVLRYAPEQPIDWLT